MGGIIQLAKTQNHQTFLLDRLGRQLSRRRSGLVLNTPGRHPGELVLGNIFTLLGLLPLLGVTSFGGSNGGLLLLLDTAPLHGRGAEDGQAAHGQTDLEALAQGLVVADQDLGQQIRGHRGGQRGGAVVDDEADVEIGQRGEALDELGIQHILADADKNRAAEQLAEEHERRPHGHVARGQDRLGRQVGRLERQAHAEAVQDLVADPHAGASADLERRQQAGADGHDADARDQERRVVADLGRQDARRHGRDDHGQGQGKQPDARVDGRDLLDGLEPDGEEVHFFSTR